MSINLINLIGAILGVITAIGVVVSSIVYVQAKAKEAKENGSDAITKKAFDGLNELVQALEKQNGLQAGQIADNARKSEAQDGKILELTGKVETLSTIPLAKIEQHMADTNDILRVVLPLLNKPSTEHIVTETTVIKK